MIKQIMPEAIIKGNKTPPRSGAFEVSMNGKTIFSKFESDSFPDKNQIEDWFK